MTSKFLTLASCSVLLATAVGVRAVPTLQLDIPGGVYNTVDATTYATTPQFTLRALYNPFTPHADPMPFYVSAALEHVSNTSSTLLPKTNPAPTVGSFKIGGTTYTPATMYWGTPPVNVPDNTSGTGPGNLATHSEFPTYYAEIAFNFNTANKVASYDTATGQPGPTNQFLYYQDFSVNVSGLQPGYEVHFDLYDENMKIAAKTGTTTYTVDDFAPFSHDAQSGPTSVPDGGTTVMLLGMGLTGLVVGRRFLRR